MLDGHPTVGRTVCTGLPLGPEEMGEASSRPMGAGAGPLAACPQGSVQPLGPIAPLAPLPSAARHWPGILKLGLVVSYVQSLRTECMTTNDVQGVLKGFADQHRAVILCYGERAQLRRPPQKLYSLRMTVSAKAP